MDDFEAIGDICETLLEFRPLSEDDLPLLLSWLLSEHVREWWDEGEHTLEKVCAAYGPEEGVFRYIIQVTNETDPPVPIGYIQHYEEGDGTSGIDIFIGEREQTGQGIGTSAVRQMAERIFSESAVSLIIIDPHPDNLRAIRCYEKAGFRHFKDFADRHGQPAYLMELKKEWKKERGRDES